ncbi:MAG: hypothetical protein QW417_05065 [Zestosphaera sp.]
MAGSSISDRSLKQSLSEDVARVASWLASYFTGITIDPLLGVAISLSFASLMVLRKLGMFVKKRKISNFLRDVQEEIISLDLEIEKIKKELSYWSQAREKVADEARKISLEDEISATRLRLKSAEDRKLYLEALLRSLKVIESLRYKYGDEIDEIFDKVVDLSVKASEGELKEKEINDVVRRLSSLTDVPDFPYLLLEVVKEKLG